MFQTFVVNRANGPLNVPHWDPIYKPRRIGVSKHAYKGNHEIKSPSQYAATVAVFINATVAVVTHSGFHRLLSRIHTMDSGLFCLA